MMNAFQVQDMLDDLIQISEGMQCLQHLLQIADMQQESVSQEGLAALIKTLADSIEQKVLLAR